MPNYIQLTAVRALTGLSTEEIERLVKAGRFPAPVRRGPGGRRWWSLSDVEHWQARQGQRARQVASPVPG